MCRLASIVERETWKLKVRQRAAVALLHLSGSQPPDSMRLQHTLARSLALALPRRLAEPQIVHNVLEPCECKALIDECRIHGQWRSLHRKYATVDMPIELLPSGPRLLAKMRECLLPQFATLFGKRYGPTESLEFRHGSGLPGLFVVRYSCLENTREDGVPPQRGLAGHVDESLVSFVLTLSSTADFTGGGTRFERASPAVVRPPCGSAVLFLGRVWHEGVPITTGERFVLVGLVNRVNNGKWRDTDS